ncbi:MAG: hypothetical protein LBN99_07935 [Oscillospiraceae bacterium]|jgi:hypothetical protein|nr:hypothetical protein [Oscillospiraceae bacterium]
MKKTLATLLAIAMLLALAAGCAKKIAPPDPTNPTPAATPTPEPVVTTPSTSPSPPVTTPEPPVITPEPTPGGNYSDEMKITYGRDLSPEDGADGVPGYFEERQGDHAGSPYFSSIDPYNMVSTDTLTILPKFRTIQQTSEWSCGVAAALMVVDYFYPGKFDEWGLGELRPQGNKPSATSLDEEIAIFEKLNDADSINFVLETTRDLGESVYEEFHLDTILNYLKNGTPVLVCWNDWGGHWQAIIGYDTMGTDDFEGDDVLIVADPYDTTDHNQDGYGVYGAERFLYNFTMYNFFGDDPADNDMLFIAAKPAA